MYRGVFVFAALAAFFVSIPQATASVVAKIDISEQRMYVYVNGAKQGSWPVSTARRGYRTPTGSFRPQRMHRRYYSRRYHGSPMPHSVFFYKGYAIHGTDQVRQLGRPASHGCIRLHPSHAARLFSLINQHGSGSTRIVITR
jgi:lipoprotein-anchoring transpeptidase ErfK/SrfK